MKLLFLVLLAAACGTPINPQERLAYDERSYMRHGIIPLPVDQTPAKEVKQKFTQLSLERGKKLYETGCLRCHGPQGLGDGPDASKQKNPVANLAATVKEVPHFQFYLSISQWQKEMPGWSTPYSAQDREDLSAYISTFKE